MSDISRTAGTCVNGYIVGGGMYGKSKELDDGVNKAAQFITKNMDCNAVIRFSSNQHNGGAFVKDIDDGGMNGNSSIGIHGCLTWSDCIGSGDFDMDVVDRYHRHQVNDDPCDVLMFYASIDIRKPDSPYYHARTRIYCAESPRYNTPEEAFAWLKEKVANVAEAAEYLDRCRKFKAGDIDNAYGKAVYVKIPSKSEARKRFVAGELIGLIPGKVVPGGTLKWPGPVFIDPIADEMQGENRAKFFDRKVASFKARLCNKFEGKAPAFYAVTYSYGENA